MISPFVLLDQHEESGVKVLGHRWDSVADSFLFKAQLTATTPTKRAILSDIVRVFDLLGLLLPITF